MKPYKNYLFLCVALCFMLCVFAPLEIFFTNKDEFWFSLKQLLPIVMSTFIATSVILLLIGYFLKKSKVFKYIYILLTCLFIFLYVQGNYIPRNYGILNGVAIDWESYTSYATASIFLLITIILLGIFLYRMNNKVYKFGYYVSVFIILIQLFTISFLYLQNCLAEKSIYGNDIVVTNKNIFNLSESNDNIVIFILDSFDSQQLLDFIQSDTGKNYTEVLENFTYYPDTLSTYPTTKGALPHILTGVMYKNEQPYTKYIQEAYSNSTIYELLETNNYSVGVYA